MLAQSSVAAVEAPARHNRRRLRIVSPRFQLRFALTFAGIGGFLCAVLTVAALHASGENPLVFMQASEDAYYRQLLLVELGGVGTIAVTLSAVYGLLLSHRVAGPVYRIRQCLSELAEGRLPEMPPLRKGDELQDVYEDLRKVREVLRRSMEAPPPGGASGAVMERAQTEEK